MLPEGTMNAEYSGSAKFLAADGVPPYVWKLMGNAPPGMSISVKGGLGVLSGTPSLAGDYNFIVQVMDSSGDPQTSQKTVMMTIKEPLTITPPMPKDAKVSVPYLFSLTASGGNPKYKWEISSGSLPDGLKLSAEDGKISGTPIKEGQATFVIKVTDSSNPVKSASAAMFINVGKAAEQ
jgi:hypothetical protein